MRSRLTVDGCSGRAPRIAPNRLHLSDKIDNPEIVRILRYLVLVGLVAAAVYIYLHRQEFALLWPHSTATADQNNESDLAGTPTPKAAPAIHPGRFIWKAVSRPEGFKVEMPCETRKIEVPAFSDRGATDQVQMILCDPDLETTFSVAWEDNPPVARVGSRAVDQILDSAKDGALVRTQTTEVSETRSTPGGNPGRDFVARNAGGGVMNARLIYAGQRLYLLSAVFPSAAARRDEDIARFFNSFALGTSTRLPD